MKINLYLIEDDIRKSAWLTGFSRALEAAYPHVHVTIINGEQAHFDSGNAQFISSGLEDPDGLLILDLILPGDSRLKAAESLIAKFSLTSGAWEAVWADFGGPRETNTKLASVVASVADQRGVRVIWNSTQNDMPCHYEVLHAVAGGRPLIYWPPNSLDPNNRENVQEALRRWTSSFERNANALATILETFRSMYVEAASAWAAARASLVSGSFKDNDGATYDCLFSSSHKCGLMHNAGAHNVASLGANKEAMRLIASSVILDVKDDDLVWFLKGIDRGNQIYLPTLAWLLGCAQSSTYARKVADCSPTNPGPVLRALQTLGRENWMCILLDVELNSIRIRFASKQKLLGSEASGAVEILRLSPRDRMLRDNRPEPGACVLALDYLKPVDIYAKDGQIFIDILMPIHNIS